MQIFPSVAIALLLPLVTHAQAQGLACGGYQKEQQVSQLICGRYSEHRISVTEDEWAEFVDREITPRFPDGLTVFSAAGQWRDHVTNKIVREPSKLVLIVLPGKTEDLARIYEIAQAYKTRFSQPSVGVILRPACVSF